MGMVVYLPLNEVNEFAFWTEEPIKGGITSVLFGSTGNGVFGCSCFEGYADPWFAGIYQRTDDRVSLFCGNEQHTDVFPSREQLRQSFPEGYFDI